MNNCKDCKYWEAHRHTCGAVEWFDDKISDDGFAIYAEAQDDSGLSCDLITGPMFGCMKFQQRSK